MLLCDTMVFQLKRKLSYKIHLEAGSLLNANTFSTSTFKTIIDFCLMLDENKLKKKN